MKNTPIPTRSALRLSTLIAGLGALGFALVPAASAAEIAWNPPVEGDGGSASWANAFNWGGTAPADNITDDIAVFSGTSAYNFNPTLDAFTVRSINGLRLGGASAVGVTIGTSTGTQTTSANVATNSTVINMTDVTGLAVGQQITGTRIPVGTFITAVDAVNNTVTISRPTSGGTLNSATVLTFTSALRVGSSGITLLSDTPAVGNIISAPLVLGANQSWNNQTTNRTLQIQGSIYLDNYTLTLNGAAGSTIRFDGSQGSGARQSIGGTGGIVVDTQGTVTFGEDNNNRMVNTFSGGVILNSGTIILHGGSAGGNGNVAGHLGTGVLTINGGRIGGNGNIATHPLSISGQVWNADWEFAGNRSVDMGVGAISLGTAVGTSRTLNVAAGAAYTLTLGGGISNGTTANTLIKIGNSRLLLNGANTYTGNTIIDEGAFTLGDLGSMTFSIGADGVNNQVTGTTTGAVGFEGDFNFIFGVDAFVDGNSWTIVDRSALSNVSFAGTFGINGFTETADDSGIWTNGSGFTFTESDGVLTYAIPEPSSFALLAGAAVLGLGALRRRRRVA